MTSLRSLGLTFCLAFAVSCAVAAEPDEHPTAASEEPAPGAGPERDSWQPQRLRQWPLLDEWLAGADLTLVEGRRPDLTSDQLIQRGESLFNMYCWQCHGREGRGDGPRSRMFDPRPRDLTAGTFKFRSTASGELPTRDDLYRTISGGLRGTGMMPFADLPDDQRWALVEFVRTLSPGFAARPTATPLPAPTTPADLDDPERATRGQQAFADLGCVQCHGDGARGDGPAAGTLRDVWKRRITPPDLVAQPAKRGRSAEMSFRTLATGLDGTPMPAYAEAASDEQLWDVVAFLRAIGPAANAPDERGILHADRVLGWQHRQGRHTVAGGCGCQARGRNP